MGKKNNLDPSRPLVRKPSSKEAHRRVYRLKCNGLTFEEIRMLFVWGPDKKPYYSNRGAVQKAFAAELGRVTEEDATFDQGKLSYLRLESMIGDVRSGALDPRKANAITRIILTQKAIQGFVANHMTAAEREAMIGAKALPDGRSGSVAGVYANWGGSDDLRDAVEIIDAEFEDQSEEEDD